MIEYLILSYLAITFFSYWIYYQNEYYREHISPYNTFITLSHYENVNNLVSFHFVTLFIFSFIILFTLVK